MIEYKYDEENLLRELKEYIDATYGQHYSQNKFQTTEFIIDSGHGVGFTVGNIMKYAQRYGKKAGRNRQDILKVLHYSMMLLYVHDIETKEIK
jgi:conjugal transfer/entry exclusion protein